MKSSCFQGFLLVIAKGHLAIVIRTRRVSPVVTLGVNWATSVRSSLGPGEHCPVFLEENIAVD